MFGFGKSDSKPKKREWYDNVRNRYGYSDGDDADIRHKMYGSLGTHNLDYLLERFAPNFINNVANVQYYKERADLWEGRYHELVTVHRELLERFDKLLEHFKCPTRPIDEVIDEVKEKIEKKYPER